MPAWRTVYHWIDEDADLKARFARAREIGFDAIAEECLEIADDGTSDTLIGQNGQEQPNSEWITRSRLRVETRLKLLAKWDPKRYGERQQVDHTSSDGSMAPADEASSAARLAAILAEAARIRSEQEK